jgi:hypothetical protein
MAYLTRSEARKKIIGVLKAFDNFLQDNLKNNWNCFPKTGYIMENTTENKRIVSNETLMQNMLIKLEDGALVEMYKNCGVLAYKYDLPNKSTMLGYNSVVIIPETEIITTATRDNDVFYCGLTSDGGLCMGWNDKAPQFECGYSDYFDKEANKMVFNIHATRIELYNGTVMRLWKGCYMGMAGGEIGFYGSPITIKNSEMKEKLVKTIAGCLYYLDGGITDVKLNNEVDELIKKAKEEEVKELMGLPSAQLKTRLIERMLSMLPILGDEKQKLKFMLLFIAEVVLITLLIDRIYPPAVTARIVLLMRVINFIEETKNIIKKLEDDNADFPDGWECSLNEEEVSKRLGLEGMAVQVFMKNGDSLIAERREHDSGFWATTFGLNKGARDEFFFYRGEIKNRIYTKNHFYFVDHKSATRFFEAVIRKISAAEGYKENGGEKIMVEMPDGKAVTIFYGKTR